MYYCHMLYVVVSISGRCEIILVVHYKQLDWFSVFSSGDLCYLFLEVSSLISLFFSNS